MLKDRMLQTLILAVPLIAIAGFLRPPMEITDTGVNARRFWSEKVSLPPAYDLVLAGDSRTFRGFSPAAMKEAMPEYRIVNYAFSGTGYEPAYLEALERLLEPSGPRKIIVLAVTPCSLTDFAVQGNGFLEEKKRGRFQRWANVRFGPVLDFFNPMNFNDIYLSLSGGEHDAHYFEEFHPDGWVASNKFPVSPENALQLYGNLFDQHQVNEKNEEVVADFTARWTSEGIVIFGLRPPSSAPMVALEELKSGFDEKRFVSRFEKAGGIWLDFDPDGYASYDGSHLQEDAALRLSRDLASKIAASLPPSRR